MISLAEIQSVKQRFGIVGNSHLLNHAVEVAMQVAATDMTVLITGASGSGKESFSKIIHNLSHRKHGQFIAINCGAIPEGTIDSELFGHEKGSFTGASEARKGYFEVTDGGTIFLDEIGEMPLGTQARLLRVLENGEFIRVGSSKVQKTDVRVVAATNVNLLQAVEKKEFREDLYYRLNTVPIYIPALKERGEDVDLLFRKFAGDFSEKYRVKPLKLTLDAKETLLNYQFPGNIRQLKNLVEQISVLEMNRDINAETLLKYLPASPNSLSSSTSVMLATNKTNNDLNERDILYQILFDMKKDMNELKKLVHELMKTGRVSEQIISEHQDLFNEINDYSVSNYNTPSTFLIEPKNTTIVNQEIAKPIQITKVQEITLEPEIESLSLESKEKEMVIKALKKNNFKRKYAAIDLGISERTLYRKLKQFDLENFEG